MSRTHRRDDDAYHGRFDRVRKRSAHETYRSGNDMIQEPDDSIFDDDDDLELDEEELAAIEDAYENECDEADD